MRAKGARPLLGIGNRLSKEGWFLLAIIALGILLRIYDLSGESMWLDETVSVRLAHKGFSAIVKNRAANFHPPLYFLLLRIWVPLFGDSESGTRSLSVLFGVASIYMLYRLASLWFDPEVGLFASLVLAASPFHIQYSQEARGYSLMGLLVLASFFFFLRLQRGGTRRDRIGYILSTSLLTYTHVFSLFIPLVQNLYRFTCPVLFRRPSRPSLRDWIFLQLWLGLLFLPWLPVLLNQIWNFQEGFRREVPRLETIFSTFGRFAGSRGLVIFLLCFTFLALWPRRETAKTGDEASCTLARASLLCKPPDLYLLGLWLLVPILLSFSISQYSAPIYKYRCLIGSSFAWYLLAAFGIRRLPYPAFRILAVAGITILSFVAASGYYRQIQKEQWREAAAYVDTIAKPGDLILFHAGYSQRPFNYYSRRSDLPQKPFPPIISAKSGPPSPLDLSSLIDGHSRVWLIVSHSHDQQGVGVKAMMQACRLLQQRSFKGIQVYLFEPQRAVVFSPSAPVGPSSPAGKRWKSPGEEGTEEP